MTKQHDPRLTGTRLNRRSLVALTAGGFALSKMGTTFAQDADMPEVSIGSKDFTEQIIISEIAGFLLEDAGYPVDRKLNLGGTAIVHQALVSGEIDTYMEYTGTGLLAILGMELPAADATEDAEMATPMVGTEATPMVGSGTDAVYDIVKREYQEQFDLVWLEPWGFNNTYTLAVTQDTANELGITKISELIGKEGDLTFGATQEFLTRPDGLPGIEETYGLSFGDSRGMDPGLIYQAVDSGDVDIISAFATDGRIPQLNLFVLEDDLGFFPPYFAAPVVRQELLDEAPEVADVLNQLAGKINDQTMASLNAQVDVDKMEAQDVARAYLQEQGLIS